MISRRTAVSGLVGLASERLAFGKRLISAASAQTEATDPIGPPAFEGRADFANAWTLLEPGSDVAFGDFSANLGDGYAESYGTTVFKAADDIHEYFEKRTKKTFSGWFNAGPAGQGIWEGAKIHGKNVDEHFAQFWNNYTQTGPVNLMQVLAYGCRHYRRYNSLCGKRTTSSASAQLADHC